jgi:hypothetical protein
MLYIANIQKTVTQTETPNQRISTTDAHIVDAVDSTEALSKLTQYYTNLNTPTTSYDIVVLSCNPLIS